MPYTPDLLLAQAGEAAEAYERLRALHPPGTVNEERNNMRRLRDNLLLCANHMQKSGIERAEYIGPFSSTQLKKGQRVRIRSGARVRSTNPKGQSLTLSRARVVTVFSVHPGYACDDCVKNPEICWVGTGGYWCNADLNDVQALP